MKTLFFIFIICTLTWDLYKIEHWIIIDIVTNIQKIIILFISGMK